MQNQWGNYGSQGYAGQQGQQQQQQGAYAAQQTPVRQTRSCCTTCWPVQVSSKLTLLWLQTQQYSYASGSQQPQQQVRRTFLLATYLVAELICWTKRPDTCLRLLVCADLQTGAYAGYQQSQQGVSQPSATQQTGYGTNAIGYGSTTQGYGAQQVSIACCPGYTCLPAFARSHVQPTAGS